MPHSFGPPRNHIAGRDYSTAIRGAVLDDRTIDRYIRAGRYGEERRIALLAATKKKAPRRTSTLRRVLALLDV